VVRPDQGDAAAVDVVDADCRQPASQGDTQSGVLLQARRDDQDPADALFLHLAHRQRGVGALLCGDDERRVLVCGGCPLCGLDELRQSGISEVVDQDADRP
jgi:hypothetical protein